MRLTVARYWLALSVSLILLVLMIGGLSMGGPSGMTGWGIFGSALIAPIALWWTRDGPLGTVLQYGYLLLATLLVGWATTLAYLSQ